MTRLTVAATEVRVGDRVLGLQGNDFTVSRIDQSLLGSDQWIAFVEDTDERWLKVPTGRDAEVEVERADG